MNLRVIKKDVDFLFNEFVTDAMLSLSFTENFEKKDQIIDLVNQVVDLVEEAKRRIAHPEGEKKTYYRELMEWLYESLDVHYDRLSEIVSKKSQD